MTRLSILLICGLLQSVFAQDTLRIMTYNVLNFRGEEDMDRADDVRRVIEWVRPDAVCMQEIHAEEAVDVLLSFSFLQVDDDWATAQFFDGPDTDNAFFYRTSRVSLYSQREISTSLRNISEYVIQPNELPDGERIRLYSAHLKASSGADNEERRRQEASTLRQQLNLLDPGSHFMMMGDFNLYSSSEPAYQLLLSASPDPDGQLFDPINRPGAWNNNISFADIHTQSPRTESFGGGTTGGMDDRFDFILVSAAFMDTAASYCLPATYRTVGNDGLHFNLSINAGNNLVVPDSIADALYYAADHLPVQCDFVLRSSGTPVDERPVPPESIALMTCYPNPFNPILNINLSASLRPATISIFDPLGRLLETQRDVRGSLHLDFSDRAAGNYWIRSVRGEQIQTIRAQFLK